MTAQQQRQITVGVITAVCGFLVIGAARAAFDSKVDKSVFDLHVQRAERDIGDTREMILELLCETKPQSRRCR